MNEGKKQIVSNNILFESEIFAKEGRGVLPFKIVVEEEKRGDIRSVVVRQIVYKPINDHAVIDEKLLLSSFWKESASDAVSAEDVSPLNDVQRTLEMFGYELQYKNVHAWSFCKDETKFIYVLPQKTANIVIHPDYEEQLKQANIDYAVYHNSNLKEYPKRKNAGKEEIYFGLKIVPEDNNHLIEVLKNL